MKKLIKSFCLSVVVSGLLVGCSRLVQEHPGEWFEQATGLSLPDGVEELNAEIITVVMVADTYYLEFKSHDALAALVAAEFTESSWSDAKTHMTPPKDWMEDLPFWNLEQIRSGTHARHRYASASGNTWISYAAHNEVSGRWFVACLQIRE